MFLPGSGPGPAPALAFLTKPDPPATQLSPVQLVQRVLHVTSAPKLSHSFSTSILVTVCVSHLSCLSHEILEVLTKYSMKENHSLEEKEPATK